MSDESELYLQRAENELGHYKTPTTTKQHF